LSLMCCVRLMNLFNTPFPVYFMNDILTTFLFLELDARQGGVEKDNSALRALFPDYFALV
ncbi:MAG TPA: hypothetical protein VN540_06140, partial [Clostridia bacterium]|nr:hypothetical protein [Clostridia bacterium]